MFALKYFIEIRFKKISLWKLIFKKNMKWPIPKFAKKHGLK